MKKELLLVEIYYKKAWKFIKEDNLSSASRVLQNEMPINIYDFSLDILYNRNLIFSNKKLKDLIKKVDEALYKEAEERELLEDHFSGQF